MPTREIAHPADARARRAQRLAVAQALPGAALDWAALDACPAWLARPAPARELLCAHAGAWWLGAALRACIDGKRLARVSPLIFKQYARETVSEAQAELMGLQVQREVLKAGWHLMVAAKGAGKVNIVRYEVLGRGGAAVSKLSAVVLTAPDRFVLPVPPVNPVLRLV